ncbi:MAG: GMC family oxidoreductase [Deltaproteobacteria bacterium]|nr:GMC family oxidoreductase [Deltaproteobacteria bacterium]
MPDDRSGETDFDWVIVGSGFGGSVSAFRLAEKGYRVLVLESGKRWTAEDFPKSNWNLRKFLWLPKLALHGFFRMKLLDDVLVLGGAGVGGGSLVYANTLLVPPPQAFERSWPEGHDWRALLAPHYATAKKMLGVADVPRDFPADTLLKRAAESMGRGHTFSRTTVGVYFGESGKKVPDPYFGGSGPDRTGCTFCGGCMTGCRVGAKNTLDKNYLWLAEQRSAQIWPETKATTVRALGETGFELEIEASTRWLRKGRRTIRARRVVVAAGVLGTVELLLRSKASGALPRLSEQLGRRVRTNSEAIIGSTARRRDVDYSEGVAIGSGVYVDDETHIEAVRYGRGHDALSLLATLLTDGEPPVPRFLRWLGQIVRHPIDFVRSLSPFGWARRTVILLTMQTLESEMRLLPRRRWFSPFSPTLSSTRPEGAARIPTYIKSANDFARVVARLQDGFPVSALNEVTLDVPTTAHILGGCSMGSSAQDGVIDAKGEVFGHPGLYVLDGSSIPANLGVNPSLTITAIAEYAMSQLPDKDSLSMIG